MRQQWRHLLFLHWEVPPSVLRPLVPQGLELDLHSGKAYVGLVPFTMRGVRPVGLPAVPGLSAFHETNVRTYVHRHGRDPGVWFFSLDAANLLAVLGARASYHLPYHWARMRLVIEPPAQGTSFEAISYASERRWPGPRPATSAIRINIAGAVAPARAGTLEHFLLERYLLYAAHGDRLYRGQVHHSPYPAQSADLLSMNESLLAAAGIRRPADTPLVHYAEGVDVEVFPLDPA
jgi:uncharacterized protein YqjF (DUF2071 family)